MTSARLPRPQAANLSPSKERFQPVSLLLLLALVLAPLLISVQPAHAQTFSVLHNFQGKPSDGENPNGELVHDASGNVYGTTLLGGTFDGGTVFKMDPAGTETVLYSFTGKTDGAAPYAGLFRDPLGNLYGTTGGGGDPTCGCGTVFRLDTNNVMTVLHTFTLGSDGGNPQTRLVSVQGVLYGTTRLGGGTGCSIGLGCGVIFKVTKAGNETVLYRFTGGADGSNPQGLVRDSAGNLYGAAIYSGTSSVGTLFKLDTAGTFSVLYTFTGGTDGGFPSGRLIRDLNGNIHGVASIGGMAGTGCSHPRDCGVVFRLSAAGTETVIKKFPGGQGGYEPSSGVLDVAGALYGTTLAGGDLTCFQGSGCGVLFQIGNTGHYTVLHRFSGGADGGMPSGELILNTDGSIYGGTATGGTGPCTPSFATGCGVIFKYTP